MNQADLFVIKALKPYMEASVYAMVNAAVEKAGSIKNLDDVAVIIELEKAKQSFGGDRSAAGRYAAQQRWGRRNNSGGGGAEPSVVSGSGHVLATTASVDDWEKQTVAVFEKGGFDPAPVQAEIAKTQTILKGSNDMMRSGMPTETVTASLKKESRRLKTLATRTRTRGEELQTAQGGQKVDAKGKKIMTNANRMFTEAFVFDKIAVLLDGLVRRLKTQ